MRSNDPQKKVPKWIQTLKLEKAYIQEWGRQQGVETQEPTSFALSR
jgi:hypothetical protein